jgi:hypothetical protein
MIKNPSLNVTTYSKNSLPNEPSTLETFLKHFLICNVASNEHTVDLISSVIGDDTYDDEDAYMVRLSEGFYYRYVVGNKHMYTNEILLPMVSKFGVGEAYALLFQLLGSCIQEYKDVLCLGYMNPVVTSDPGGLMGEDSRILTLPFVYKDRYSNNDCYHLVFLTCYSFYSFLEKVCDDRYDWLYKYNYFMLKEVLTMVMNYSFIRSPKSKNLKEFVHLSKASLDLYKEFDSHNFKQLLEMDNAILYYESEYPVWKGHDAKTLNGSASNPSYFSDEVNTWYTPTRYTDYVDTRRFDALSIKYSKDSYYIEQKKEQYIFKIEKKAKAKRLFAKQIGISYWVSYLGIVFPHERRYIESNHNGYLYGFSDEEMHEIYFTTRP